MPQSLLQKVRSQKTQEFILKCQKAPKIEWDTLFHDVDPAFVQLLKGLLEYDPEKRLSAEQALKLPLFKGVGKPGAIKPRELKTFEFEFEKFTLNRAIFKELILDEVLLYRCSRARKDYI